MRPLVFFVVVFSYAVQVYHLTQHTEQSASLLLWYTLTGALVCAWACYRRPDIEFEDADVAIPLWWLVYFVAWLDHWPPMSSEVLIGGAVVLCLWFTVKRMDWVLP